MKLFRYERAPHVFRTQQYRNPSFNLRTAQALSEYSRQRDLHKELPFGSNIESLRLWVVVPHLTSDELVLCRQWLFPRSNQYSSICWGSSIIFARNHRGMNHWSLSWRNISSAKGAFQRSTEHLRSATIPCKVLQSPYYLHWVTQKIISAVDRQVVLFHQCIWFSMDMHKVFETRLDAILQNTLNFCITPTEMGKPIYSTDRVMHNHKCRVGNPEY